MIAVNEKTSQRWEKASLGDLIDYIVNVHHAYLYKALPEIDQYARTIESVHGSYQPELGEVRKLVSDVRRELELHLTREEKDMFPLIGKLEREPSYESLRQAERMIRALESDHQSCEETLARLRTVTNDYELPEWACPTYKLAYEKLQELETDLALHAALEDEVLFPRALGRQG
ncbi:hypothetical protein B1A99_05970 [Cohnella sp. CIP 111063]|nr:hypothetical protein B1A99_05970 [Cohnella sp. CIP 111063]